MTLVLTPSASRMALPSLVVLPVTLAQAFCLRVLQSISAPVGVTLITNSSVDTTDGAGPGSTITFGGQLDGAFDLALTAGAAALTFDGVVGGVTPLGVVTVNEVSDLNINDVFIVGSINQAVAGTGTTAVNGPVFAQSGQVRLNNNTVDVNQNIDATGNLIDLDAATELNIDAAATLITTAEINSGAASGAIQLGTTDGRIIVNGDLISTGAANLGVGSDGGAVVIAASQANGEIEISGDISSSGGASTLPGRDGGAAGTVNVSTIDTTIAINGSTIVASGGQPEEGFAGVQGAGGTVTFASPVSLGTAKTSISTGATIGDIIFNGALDSATAQDLELTSGQGNISFVQAVGAGGNNLGAVTVNAAASVAFGSTSTFTSFTQADLGTGTFQIADQMTATTGAVEIQSETVDLNAGIQTTGQLIEIDSNAGNVSLENGSLVTTGGDDQAGGAIEIDTAGGSIVLNGSLTTTGGNAVAGAGQNGGAVSVAAFGAGTVTFEDGANIDTRGSAAAAGVNAGGAGGAVTIDSENTTITLTATDIQTSGAAGFGGGATGAGGVVTIGDTPASDVVELATNWCRRHHQRWCE